MYGYCDFPFCKSIWSMNGCCIRRYEMKSHASKVGQTFKVSETLNKFSAFSESVCLYRAFALDLYTIYVAVCRETFMIYGCLCQRPEISTSLLYYCLHYTGEFHNIPKGETRLFRDVSYIISYIKVDIRENICLKPPLKKLDMARSKFSFLFKVWQNENTNTILLKYPRISQNKASSSDFRNGEAPVGYPHKLPPPFKLWSILYMDGL